jgi:hypothetical protein
MNAVQVHAGKRFPKDPYLLPALFSFVHDKAEFPVDQAKATLHRNSGGSEAVLLVRGSQLFHDGLQVFKQFGLRQFRGRCFFLHTRGGCCDGFHVSMDYPQNEERSSPLVFSGVMRGLFGP